MFALQRLGISPTARRTHVAAEKWNARAAKIDATKSSFKAASKQNGLDRRASEG